MRDGKDSFLYPDFKTGVERHTFIPVHREMILQVCSDYSGLPDYRTMRMSEIRFFYEGARHSLRKATEPPKPSKIR